MRAILSVYDKAGIIDKVPASLTTGCQRHSIGPRLRKDEKQFVLS